MKHEIFEKICPLPLMYTVNYVVCTTIVLCFNLCSTAVCFSHYIWPSSDSLYKTMNKILLWL